MFCGQQAHLTAPFGACPRGDKHVPAKSDGRSGGYCLLFDRGPGTTEFPTGGRCGNGRVPGDLAAAFDCGQGGGGNQGHSETSCGYPGKWGGDSQECCLDRRSFGVDGKDRNRSIPSRDSHGLGGVEEWIRAAQTLYNGVVLPGRSGERTGPSIWTTGATEPNMERAGSISRSELEGIPAIPQR